MRRSLLVAVAVVVVALSTLSFSQGSASTLHGARSGHSHGPTLTAQSSGTVNRLQTISPVSESVVWVSGVAGTYAITTDGGKSWQSHVVPGAETLQFRDVQGSAKVAYILSAGVGTDSRIYKTEDGFSAMSTERREPTYLFTDHQVASKSEIARRFLETRTRLNANVDTGRQFSCQALLQHRSQHLPRRRDSGEIQGTHGTGGVGGAALRRLHSLPHHPVASTGCDEAGAGGGAQRGW